jgi:hypothetical protein
MKLTGECGPTQSGISFALVLALFTIFGPAPARAGAITTHHYDNGRTGWNQQETILTPANVGKLQLLTTVALDEQVDAQPLYVPGMTIGGGRHNVLYVATENDTIYALDAVSGAIRLQMNFGAAVPQSALPSQCNNNSAVVGINSTPVIDLASNTLYVMIYTYENNIPIYRLHALDLATLIDKASPAVVQATATLSDGSSWSFQAAYSRQRAALLEANGNIYAAFGSFCDFNPNYSRGWLLGWNAGSLAPLAANLLNNKLTPAQSPNDFFLSSIWMSGSGPAADWGGNLFFATGNSDPSGTTYSSTYNLSESIVKISPDLSKVLSHFTPWGSAGVVNLDRNDEDFGSGGVLRVPGHPGNLSLATAAGKAGIMYLLNLQSLGGYHNPDRVLGTFSIGWCWCGESYFTGWDGIGRIVSSGGFSIMVWRLQTSPAVTLVNESTSPTLPITVQDAGFFTSVSSNRTSNTVVWAVGRPVDSNPANVTLYAFDPQAAAGGNNAWLFSGFAGTWPNVGGNANIVPVVANGRVYVASYKELAIFGLPPGGAAMPAPVVPRLAPARPELPANGHEIFATIKTVAGANVTVATRTGKLVRVDAAKAMQAKQSVVLLVGEPVRVLGSYDNAGILRATSIAHAKPAPQGWPADR